MISLCRYIYFFLLLGPEVTWWRWLAIGNAILLSLSLSLSSSRFIFNWHSHWTQVFLITNSIGMHKHLALHSICFVSNSQWNNLIQLNSNSCYSNYMNLIDRIFLSFQLIICFGIWFAKSVFCHLLHPSLLSSSKSIRFANDNRTDAIQIFPLQFRQYARFVHSIQDLHIFDEIQT